jgi:Rrf2 family protein
MIVTNFLRQLKWLPIYLTKKSGIAKINKLKFRAEILMKITALQEYGMRCIFQLAMVGSEKPLTTSTIAEREGLSRDYVEKILFQLRKTGLVRSVRGINGGYVLTRKPDSISIGETLMALSEKRVRLTHIKEDLCRQFPGNEERCIHMTSCSIRMLWSLVIVKVYSALNTLPLSTLIGSEEEVQSRIKKSFDPVAPAAKSVGKVLV